VTPGDRASDVATFMLYVGGTAAIVSMVVTPSLFVLIGLPLYGLSIRRRWTSAFHYAAGALAVTIPLCALLLYSSTRWIALQPQDVTLAIIIMLIVGPSAALVFWKVVRPQVQRP
jgi:hypothetical protein